MRIYVSHSKIDGYDFRENLYEPIKSSALAKEHQFTFPYDGGDSTPHSMKDEIMRSSFVIAEASYPSTSSGIELGWANEHGKTIYCIYQHGREYSRSLLMLTKHIDQYSGAGEMLEKITNFIKSNPGPR